MHRTITYFTDSDINREHSSKDSKIKGDERKWRLNNESESNVQYTEKHLICNLIKIKSSRLKIEFVRLWD